MCLLTCPSCNTITVLHSLQCCNYTPNPVFYLLRCDVEQPRGRLPEAEGGVNALLLGETDVTGQVVGRDLQPHGGGGGGGVGGTR